MAHLSLQQAQATVDDIRVTNGGFSPEVQKALPEEALRAFKNLQSIAGGSIVHVAEDLYDADTRFIFELIQNAEDNCYDHAASHGEEPFLHLTLHADHITVDSNEDGFTENDVRAICSIHRSTKKQTGGYIGHKGIGFKSVFKVAYKVSIQSGPFCFCFEHRRGESGLGMITPFNEKPRDLPPGVNTRITLFLTSVSDFDSRASELREIPDTMLLFLRKLQRLTIEILPLQSRISFKRHEDSSKRLVTLTKETNGEQLKRFYHLEKATLSNLPQHYSRPDQREVDLILAFPVNADFSPLIEAQYVYSFLPMRHEGFNFLVQSDFITQANRQGIHHCDRNRAIRDGISSLFLQAVNYFCRHTSLKYEWLQYLPGMHIHDPFWADLREMIFDRLKGSKIIMSRKGALNYPKKLEHLSSQHCDRHGQPLLDDIDPEVYLSQSYRWTRHAENLTELGVASLSSENILDRLVPYLEGSSPKFLDPSLDDDWHTKIAALLLRALKRQASRSLLTERIRKMALVPTSDGSLLSARSSAVYFPDDERENPIPEGLKDIRIVQRSVLENKTRRELLEALGVARCNSNRVVKSILELYNVRHGVTLEKSVSHLRYLFKTLGKGETLDNRIFIKDQMGKQVYRAFVTLGPGIIKDDLYFETQGEYGTKELAQKLRCGFNQQSCPPFEMHIIHSAYIEAVPPGTVSNGRTWEQWLEEVALVRCIPRLKSSWADELSTLCQHLANYHPMTLIGILKTNWSSYQAELTPGVIEALEEMEVPCRNHSKAYLRDTYYPSKEMQQLCSDATLEEIFDEFIDAPANLATDDIDGWEFLASFGVTLEADFWFFWNIFRCLVEKAPLNIQAQAAFFRMYKELSIRFRGASNKLRQIFAEWKGVCIPTRSGETFELAHDSECVWNGHHTLRTKHPLAIHPEYSNDPHVAYLFKDILSVSDADVSTYLEELQWCKDNADVALEDLRAIYDCISQNIQKPEDRALILSKFTERKLVYLLAERAWLAPESCVWADALKIGAQYGISAVYPELESFFRGPLNVQTPTAATYLEQLRRLASDEVVDIGAVKAAIYDLNGLRPGSDELRGLSHIKFLPVAMPNGTVEILKPTDTFFIADRIEYLSAFRDKVPILDFSLEEVRCLHQLLGRIGLEDRYMSTAVLEKTVVGQPSHEHCPSETRELRKKATHIYRCILHYSEEGRETVGQRLRQLQNVLVYESAGFKKSLVLQLNEVTARVQSDTGLVHIEDVSDVLRIYIPRDDSDRQRCYHLDLPQALRRHFGLRDSAASFSFALIFLTPENLIDESLDRHGIVRISPDISQQLESESTDTTISEAHVEEGNVFSGSEESRESGEGIDTPRSSPETTVELPRTIVTHYRTSTPPPRLFSVPPPDRASPDRVPRPFSEHHPYIQLLDKVIRLARPLTLSEALQRPMNTVLGNANTSHELVFGVRSENLLAHDIKIGAAGELFVFELLSSSDLPGFNRGNWRSNIRRHVSVHPDYHDLAPWSGVETADLVYRDTRSTLTTILIDAGYLSHARWCGANPTYYIEVKTTTGECDSAFFMSKSQYRRRGSASSEGDEKGKTERKSASLFEGEMSGLYRWGDCVEAAGETGKSSESQRDAQSSKHYPATGSQTAAGGRRWWAAERRFNEGRFWRPANRVIVYSIRVALSAASRPPTYLPILQYNAPAVFVCDGGAGPQVGPGAVGWTAQRP
ncbi:uncharacterized protein CDV56_101060 [Aspergillus thermomutatus]|uniref:Protein NO VEIN C-terminal domain-containing protein n=1 Tax=Aspergillus thermomutatus TaxID=41047 RepID=A0A397G2T6_ASPTH|nr:uncharacterized protein CDV56_101060 [Aspergillus thermomutatus]RHZ43626.1 hypothetical protein CDV56_101060 [Aspergillus thermomutatus]